MNLKDFFKEDLVIYDLDVNSKDEILRKISERLFERGYVSDLEGFYNDIKAREEVAHTAFESAVATPHAKSKYVLKPVVLVAKSKEGVDFSNGEEVKTKLFFTIAVPETEANLHLDILSKLALILDDKKAIENILNSNNLEEILSNFEQEEKTSLESIKSDKFIVAVTACPTGIAHTFMAKDSLVNAANEMGVKIKVETNGTDGRKNEITKEDLEKAEGVILAINKSVDEDRFNGYRVIKVGAKEAISNAKKLIQDTLDNKGTIAKFEKTKEEVSSQESGIYKHLMNGVSYMLPLVISGGILIALAFLADSLLGFSNAGSGYGSTSDLAKTLMGIGAAAFSLFVPILGGYIAYSISEKAALASGLVAGVLASQGGSGFLGALAGGIFAGYLTKLFTDSIDKISKKIRGIYLILVIPVLTVLIVGLAMIFMLNPIVGYLNWALTDFLHTMSDSSKIILGFILGGMMAVDMGGPVNKAAYLFGTGTLANTLATGGSSAMAAVMAGGMVPPLAIAIATTLFKNKYTKQEREAGISNYVMGLSFITEGAIPFAAANPLRVIPALIIGSGIAGALTMFANIKIPAPHGGILIMFLSNNFIVYILCVLVSSIISAILLGILKQKN